MRKARSPFEKNFGLLHIKYFWSLDLGLYLRIRPRDWVRTFWGHPEADVIWYDIGPFAFYKVGIYS